MQTSHRFDLVVNSYDGPVRVRCRPRGSSFRDVTDRVDAINYFTEITGLLGVVGWVLHRTVFLSKWFVTAEFTTPAASASVRFDGLSKSRAQDVFQRLIEWLEADRSMREFDPASRTSARASSRHADMTSTSSSAEAAGSSPDE